MNNKVDAVWFHRIVKPISQLLDEQQITIEHDSAVKLVFEKFLTLLLYFYLKGIDTLRSLITELKSNQDIDKIGLFLVGLSTIHDAFHRYSLVLFQNIYCQLLRTLPINEIEEFKEFGRLIISDGSIFRMAINDFWADFRDQSKALKLHLQFELNQMLTTCFCVTSANSDERKILATQLEPAVTYIADRGYLCFNFFFQIVEKGAFFIIRSRKNLTYQIKQPLAVQLIDAVQYLFFHVTDELVVFKADHHQQCYRRISFRTHETLFVLITNRFDLSTYQIIRLYAFRWQIELFFRFFKRALNAIHLINHSQNGVTIQFYVILIVNLLLIRFKQQQLQQYLFDQKQNHSNSLQNMGSVEYFMKNIGNQIPNDFKIRKQELNTIRIALLMSVQLAFDFF